MEQYTIYQLQFQLKIVCFAYMSIEHAIVD